MPYWLREYRLYRREKGCTTAGFHNVDPNATGSPLRQGTAAAQRLIWDGHLHLTDGNLSDIVPIAQQCPLDTINQKSDTHITWTSATAGNDMGFTCTLDALPSAALNITTDPCTFT